MESFVNRQATNINRKRLNVVDVEHDSSGNVTSLIVDEVRADSEGCTVTGTRLDKESIESAVLNLIYEKIYGLQFNTGVDDLLYVDSDRSIKVTHINSLVALYPKCEYESGMRYAMAAIRKASDNSVTVSFSINPDYESAYVENLTLQLYLDSAFTKLLCQIPIAIHFTPSSTGSGD